MAARGGTHCLNSGAVKEYGGTRAHLRDRRPGACGIDYPLRVSALGESGPLGLRRRAWCRRARSPTPRCRRPMPQHWPIAQLSRRHWPGASPAIQSSRLAAGAAGAPQSYPAAATYRRRRNRYPAPLPTRRKSAHRFRSIRPVFRRPASRTTTSIFPAARRILTTAGPARPSLRQRRNRQCRRSARPARPMVTASAGAGASEAAGDARLPDRVRARSMDQPARCSPRRSIGFASRSSRSSKSPPIPAAA